MAVEMDPSNRLAISLGGLELRPRDRALVLGGYGVRNVGDEAILAGLLSSLPGEAAVRVVSRTPAETASFHHVASVSPFGALAALLRSEVLIVGGGGLFSSHMGPFGRVIPLITLTALALRKRVAYHGVGVYPTTPPWVQRMLRLVGPRLTSFTVRDAVSAQLVRSWGIPVEQIPDLSTLMSPAPRARGTETLRSLGLEPGRPTVGLCLTATEPRLREPLMEAVPALIDSLPGTQFCFVPMSQHPRVRHHNDLLLARDLKTRSPRLAVLESWMHPADIVSLFGQFTVAVCMRYHSLLFAERAGAVVIPVQYAEKVESWAKEHGQVPSDLTAEALTARVRAALIQKTA